jgi:hypothetical protein
VETWTDTPGDWLAILSIFAILFAALGWYIRTEMAKTRMEFRENGGSTAKDQWVRIETDLLEIKSMFLQHLINHQHDRRKTQEDFDGPDRRDRRLSEIDRREDK